MLTSGSAPVLILFASRHGHTERIAARIAQNLCARSVPAHVQRVGDEAPAPAGFAGVVIAGSVHAGSHQRELREYVALHRDELNRMTSAFISVSLTAADDTDEARATTGRLISDFIDATGWRPGLSLAVAGALQFEEYDFATRLVMRVIAKQHGADTRHDQVFTDWEAVDAFAADLAEHVALARVAPVATRS
jgi:menaquinone-dependent protoporphyrinogen oxidase